MTDDKYTVRPIAVNTATTFPENLREKLSSLDSLLASSRSFSEAEEQQDFCHLLELLDSYLEERGVFAYHFTRADPESIRLQGLVTATGSERRKWFINEYGHRFTQEQLDQIHAEYDSYFNEFRNSSRDGRIWFNLSKTALENGGAAPLLEYFGGEMIYMPLQRIIGVADVVRTIGKPLMVSFKVRPSQMFCYTNHPAARVWLSAYYAEINTQAEIRDHDIWVTEAISPRDILDIEINPVYQD